MGFSVADTMFSEGDTVVLTLSNQSARGVGHNLCKAALQRRAGTRWDRISRHQPPDEDVIMYCADVLAFLLPDRSVTERKPITSEMSSGTYRFRGEVLRGESWDTLISNEFRVRR